MTGSFRFDGHFFRSHFMRPCCRWSSLVLVLGLLAGAALVGKPGRAEPEAPSSQPQSLTREQQDWLPERKRLGEELKKLYTDGKLNYAIATAEKILVRDQEQFGEHSDAVSDSSQALVSLYEQQAVKEEKQEDFPAAHKARQEGLALQ